MTKTTFKTTDFKTGDIIAYKDNAGDHVYVLELLDLVHDDGFRYQIVVDAMKAGREGRSDSWWFLSKAELVHNVIAKW